MRRGRRVLALACDGSVVYICTCDNLYDASERGVMAMQRNTHET